MAGYGPMSAEHGETVYAHGEGVRRLDRCFVEALGNDGRIDDAETKLLIDLIDRLKVSFADVHRGAEEAHVRETIASLALRRGVTPWFVRQVMEQAQDVETLVCRNEDERIAA